MANMKLPNLPSENEITDFLSKVDEIDGVLKGLNSKDEADVEQYMSKADTLIKEAECKQEKKDGDQGLPKTKTGFSKTSINKNAYKNDPESGMVEPSAPADGPMDQRAFMAAMEADAAERAERRRKKEIIANRFKEQGNVEFRQGNYTKALEFYDKGMAELKDSLAIYTNRAQTRIKLGMFTEALTDCDWALRLWPSSLKALVHQGHAYLGLKEFDKARDSYRQILDIDKKKEAMVTDYIATVDREEQARNEEEKASRLFDEGNNIATGVVNFLTRIKKDGQLPVYYSGGFRAITNIVTDIESQTLFRTHGGLQLPQTQSELKRCLTTPALGDLSTADRDLVSAAMAMFEQACKDNETSQQDLLSVQDFPRQLMTLIDTQYKGQGRILKTRCLNLMHTISLTSAGRAAIISKFDLIPLISSMFMLMTKNCAYAETAAALLNNMALEKRLKSATRDTIEVQILPAFESLMKSNKTSPAIVALASSTFTNLAADITIRVKLAGRQSFWTAMSDLMVCLTEAKLCSTLEYVLGLLVNVSTSLSSTSTSSSSSSSSLSPSSSNIFKNSNSIHETCFNMASLSRQPVTETEEDSNTNGGGGGGGDWTWISPLMVMRCLAVLSNLLPHSDTASGWLGDKDRVLVLMDLLQDEDITNTKSVLKCLTVLSQNNDSARDVMAENKGTSLLLKLLEKQGAKQIDGGGGGGGGEEGKGGGQSDPVSQEDREVILGNATLCLSHLAARPEVCRKLTKTNIIQRLLVLARDGRKAALQSNAAILVGKLVKGDARHLERLRELHGIEILHSCMKHIK